LILGSSAARTTHKSCTLRIEAAIVLTQSSMKLKWPLIAGVVMLAAILLAASMHRATPVSSQAATAEVPPAAVAVATVERRDLPYFVKASGRAEAKASVIVKSRIDGQVAAILFNEGRSVRKGQVLLRMDPAPAEAQLEQAKALVARDQAQLERLAGDSRRNTSLYEQGFISNSGLSQIQADLRAAEATLKADQANVASARLQLGFTNVVAPVDGVAGAALLPVGGAAKANDTALVVVNQIKPIYISFAVPETELGRLKHAIANGPVPVSASVPGSNAALSGRLAFLDNAVDATTGAIVAKASFANEDGGLTPGQFADLRVTVDHLSGAVVVPAPAVESGADGPFVFVVKENSTVEIRSIKVVTEVDGVSVVAAGLVPGERVVTDGQSHLREGKRVTITGAPAAAAARSP